MNVQSFHPQQGKEPHLTLTPSATKHFQDILKEKPQQLIVFDIEKTGCSGFGYATYLVDSVQNNMHLISPEYNLPLYIAEQAIPFLSGITVDYAILPKSAKGLIQKGLIYFNPNETGRCGCGESFTIDPQFSKKEGL